MQREEAAGLQGCRQPQSKVLQLTGHLRLLLLLLLLKQHPMHSHAASMGCESKCEQASVCPPIIWTGLGCPVRRWLTGRSDSWVTQAAPVENKREEDEEEEEVKGGGKPLEAC